MGRDRTPVPRTRSATPIRRAGGLPRARGRAAGSKRKTALLIYSKYFMCVSVDIWYSGNISKNTNTKYEHTRPPERRASPLTPHVRRGVLRATCARGIAAHSAHSAQHTAHSTQHTAHTRARAHAHLRAHTAAHGPTVAAPPPAPNGPAARSAELHYPSAELQPLHERLHALLLLRGQLGHGRLGRVRGQWSVRQWSVVRVRVRIRGQGQGQGSGSR